MPNIACQPTPLCSVSVRGAAEATRWAILLYLVTRVLCSGGRQCKLGMRQKAGNLERLK